MSNTKWVEAVDYANYDGTAVASTTTETSLRDIDIPAHFADSERGFILEAFGQYSNTGTPTMIFSVRWGGAAGVLLCKTAAVTTPSGVTAAGWYIWCRMQFRTSGTAASTPAGTVMANGFALVFAAVAPTVASATGGAAVTPMTNGGVVTPAIATVDTTIAKTLSLTLTWSANSASNTAKVLNADLYPIN